jgi:hypothetical protein
MRVVHSKTHSGIIPSGGVEAINIVPMGSEAGIQSIHHQKNLLHNAFCWLLLESLLHQGFGIFHFNLGPFSMSAFKDHDNTIYAEY